MLIVVLLLSALSGARAAKTGSITSILKMFTQDTDTHCPKGQKLWPMFVLNNTLHPGCTHARLKADPKDKVALLAAAEILRRRGHAEAETAAVAMAGTAPSKFVEHWWYLGPFVIGKHEIDGDPAAHNVFGSGPSLDAVMYSEVR